MYYADIKELDIQDGEGARVSIYVSGCHFHCPGCHNKEAWDFNYGKEFTQKEIDYIIDLMDNDYISGLSILGGEPLELVNQNGLLPLVNKVKERFPEKNIWCYTGYDFEEDVLGEMFNKYECTKELLKKIDIIVDGQFVQEKKIADLKFRGSYNQRKIDVKSSIASGSVCVLKFGDESRYESKSNPKIIWITDFTKEVTNVAEPVYSPLDMNTVNNDNKKLPFEITKEKISVAAKGIV